MTAPFKSLAVANRFIELSGGKESNLTLMKLLKVVYFAHGWHLAITGNEPLVDDAIEAWKFGPVAPSIYHSFKEYGSSPITDFGKEAVLKDNEVIYISPVLEGGAFIDALTEKMWEIYGAMSAFQLSDLTHLQGTPWHKVWFEMGGCKRKGVDIPDSMIAEYFKGKLNAQ